MSFLLCMSVISQESYFEFVCSSRSELDLQCGYIFPIVLHIKQIAIRRNPLMGKHMHAFTVAVFVPWNLDQVSNLHWESSSYNMHSHANVTWQRIPHIIYLIGKLWTDGATCSRKGMLLNLHGSFAVFNNTNQQNLHLSSKLCSL